MECYLEIEEFGCHYTSDQVIINAFSLKSSSGDIVLIKGPNGSGKSTLLRAIAGISPRKITTTGVINASHRPNIIFPDPKKQILTFSVQEELSTRLSFKGVSRATRKELVENLIQEFNIQKLRNKDPKFLSGGEQQKVITLANLIDQPQIILMDEPFMYLDAENILQMKDFIAHLSKQGSLIMVVTHLNVLDNIASRIVFLDGQELQDEKWVTVDENSKFPYFIKGKLGYSTYKLSVDIVLPDHGLIIIAGMNGSGKTLLLKTLAGILKMKEGKVSFTEICGYLPQQSEYLFSKATVAEEFRGIQIPQWAIQFRDMSPFQLSTGYQKIVLLSILFEAYDVLLLDEPFQSLDQNFSNILRQLIVANVRNKLILLSTNRDFGDLKIRLDERFVVRLGEI